MNDAAELKTCCAALYESDFARLLLGDSFHPGGLPLTARLGELLSLAPGQRVHAHRHALDYFWIATTAGRSRQHTSDGTTRDVSYHPGDSKYLTFDRGEYLLHDLNNTGETELVFVTVEHLDSANEALTITSPEEA